MHPENDQQTELLRLIWSEMKVLGTNLGGRIDALGTRIDETNRRLDETNTRLEQLDTRLTTRIDRTNERLDETNARLAVVEETLKDLAGQQLLLTRYVKHSIDRHDVDIAELRARVERLEGR